jgi:DNA-binding HxlR family transcriptional regulator
LEPVAATDLFDEDFFRVASECTVEAWLAFLGHRWNALILYQLSLGPKRFGEIGACLPTIAPKVLTERLGGLERYGLVKRPAGGRGEAYALTERGTELMPILNQLEIWSRELPKLEPSR